MNDSQRHFLKRQCKAFAEMAQAHLPWVLDGMEPQNRRSIEARRQAMAAGRAIGINDGDLAGFFRMDRVSVWGALSDDQMEVFIAPASLLETALLGPECKRSETILNGLTRPRRRYNNTSRKARSRTRFEAEARKYGYVQKSQTTGD